MDGNGRWATQRNKYRTSGHKAGVESVRKTIKQCSKIGVKWLTLFAFSSENWNRPKKEVNMLMELFTRALKKEVPTLYKNGVQLKFVGDLSKFSQSLRGRMEKVSKLTENNNQMILSIAVNYGGRWDIVQASQALAKQVEMGQIESTDINEKSISEYLSLSYAPDPDLLIRTGGEKRISNFLLFQCAYSELYFTETYWPDFDEASLMDAVSSFNNRERRFGKTSQQLIEEKHA